ncbi:MAG: AAA family ATPase, partial [Methanomassiliicoccaceae archaeon]|nr:AAA family ATPase [Methanomassiliicoccaceae archaeon]
MKIKKISVYGLFGRHDHTVNVFPEGLTYIHSPNGCGKSTLIKMISLLFAGGTEALAKIPFDRMDISFANDENLIVERSDNSLLVQMQRNEIETEMSADELASLVKAMFITSERTYVSGADGCAVPAAESYAAELLRKLRDAKSYDAQGAAGSAADMDDDKFVFFAKDLNAKLSFMRDAGFDIEIPAGLKFPPTRYDLMDSRDEYNELVNKISQFVERNYYLSESVTVFKDLINNFFIDKDMMIDEKDNISFVFANGMNLPVKDLSSGEKQIFILLYRLLFHTMPSSFVMIDEPETSLHVSWQQRIGTVLKDIARLRDLQI